MWNYYGSKTNIVKAYPRPTHNKIIEPFAGSARYSLKYFDRDVLLVDKYDVVIKIWKWLQKCSEGDILKLPKLKAGDRLEQINFDCEEARMFYGFICGFSIALPRKIVSPSVNHRPNKINFTIKNTASNLFKIKHWNIILGSYEDIENKTATWYIDPPYQVGGQFYKESNKNINFESLGNWCKSRDGQVIACEKIGATWLDFKPLITQITHNGAQDEVIWTNHKLSYKKEQLKIFV